MLGVRLKTWVKTHLGRERHGGGSGTTTSHSFISSPQSIRPLSVFHFMNSSDKHGLRVNTTLLSSPDTGYSTDGLSKTASNSSSSILTSATGTRNLHNNSYYSNGNTITKREWFLQDDTTNVVPPPPNFQTLNDTSTSKVEPSVALKPSRIKTNPWYNPKSKRLTTGKAVSGSSSLSPLKNNDNQHDQLPAQRLSTCTTTDSGEGSFDSQKSSPRVSFSSSSESYPEHCVARLGEFAFTDYKTDPRLGMKIQDERTQCSSPLMHDYYSREKHFGKEDHPEKSPHPKINSWHQPNYHPQSSSTVSPYLIHDYTSQDDPENSANTNMLSPGSVRNERKRKRFNFLRKLFKKGQNSNKKTTNSSINGKMTNEVSIHDLYYHRNVLPSGSVAKTSSHVPPVAPPRISSFLTPTPNAFRRRTILPASAARMNLTPHIGYTNRPHTATIKESVRSLPNNINGSVSLYAAANVKPKLSSKNNCSPSRQPGYSDYYSTPPVLPAQPYNAPNVSSQGRSFPCSVASPLVTRYGVNETPSKRVLNRKLILQSPTPFINNSSYSPIHRVAVLKGASPSMNSTFTRGVAPINHSVSNGQGHLDMANTLKTDRPEFFSPQLQQSYLRRQNHSIARDFCTEFNGRTSYTSTFFSPQPPNPRGPGRGRCFQYISSSNQNSPILNAHRDASSRQSQTSNRFSPIISAPFNHRVHPIKNYILRNSPSPVRTRSSLSQRRCKEPKKYLHVTPAVSVQNATPTKPIDKIYEEIDDEDEVPIGQQHGIGLGRERETAITDDTLGEEEEFDPSKAAAQNNYSDEGDEQGGVYYQLDYDSSLLSTTEESQETSTASTSTLLKTINEQTETQSIPISKLRHQTLPLTRPPSSSTYAVAIDKQESPTTIVAAGRAIAAADLPDVSSAARHLLEIENDLRFCRLIAEAQTLLRELECNTASSLAATKENLQEYYRKGNNTSLRKSVINSSNTYRRSNGRITAATSSSSFFPGQQTVGFDDCPQSDPLRRKAYECWALRRLQQELSSCCASPLAFRHNLVPRQRTQTRSSRSTFL